MRSTRQRFLPPMCAALQLRTTAALMRINRDLRGEALD
jgi:hypothetical protein